MIDSFIYVSAILILAIFLPERFGDFSASLNLFYSGLYFFLVIFFLIRHRRFTKNWVRFDVIFLIGFTIVHIQIPALASLGIEPARPGFIWINKDVVNFATWLSVMAIALWMWGYSTYKFNKQPPACAAIERKVKSYFVFDILLALSFLAFIATVGPALFSGIYDGTRSWGAGSEYAFLVLRTLLYLRIIYFFKDLPRKSSLATIAASLFKNWLFFVVLAVFVFIFLSVGNRGPVLKVSLLSAGSYAFFIRPISFNKLVAFVLIGAILFTILGMGRGRDASTFGDQNIFERGYSSFLESESLNITDELASSNRILYMALDTVPERHPYLYGTPFLINIAGVVPFLARLTVTVFDIPRMYWGTSSFFTIISLGPNATWGVGSQVTADIYVNFGIVGVFVLMFLFGRFAAKCYVKASDLNMTYVIISLCLLVEALSMNRGLLLYPLKPIVYMLIINYVFSKVKS
ncbi:O-antigen polymerase [Halomonas sp. RA08-2]|uniref:O-antigen polymerase n=1 Tax=Halomonas sp. RA08-2 TaxID=3440842 RepID=UPI003EEA2542